MPPATFTSKVLPSEVGWQFVPQYYTFVNKQPHRLHCFYTKLSTFVHGTEGEDCHPCYGQQEIHTKILSLDFQDCKVFIHSVDAQSSANNGIIIQVIGEMSNKGLPWRKFVQTFFLAEQLNGYFVLNDILRFLKEEDTDITDCFSVEKKKEEQPEACDLSLQKTDDQTLTIREARSREGQIILEAESFSEHDPAFVDEDDKTEILRQPPLSPVSKDAKAEFPIRPDPEPVEGAPSWAKLAASNSGKWGGMVAQDSKGTTEVMLFSHPSNSTDAAKCTNQTGAKSGFSSNGSGNLGKPTLSGHESRKSVTTGQVFVKGIIDAVSIEKLSGYLSSRFGPIKDIEMIRSKACALIEFVNMEDARDAVLASMPPSPGGEGGMRIEADLAKIYIEPRKERGDRFQTRIRGFVRHGGRGRGRETATATSQY